MRGLLDWFGGRKWVFILLCFMAGTAALWTERLGGMEWVTLVLGLATAYGVTNAASKFPTRHQTPLSAPQREEMMDVGH